jgi:sulfite reductase alpha subunit-like flavoprotein
VLLATRVCQLPPPCRLFLVTLKMLYVCGDAMRMAKDVDAALRRIAMSEGRLNESQAKDWIVALARQGRSQRDVY